MTLPPEHGRQCLSSWWPHLYVVWLLVQQLLTKCPRQWQLLHQLLTMCPCLGAMVAPMRSSAYGTSGSLASMASSCCCSAEGSLLGSWLSLPAGLRLPVPADGLRLTPWRLCMLLVPATSPALSSHRPDDALRFLLVVPATLLALGELDMRE